MAGRAQWNWLDSTLLELSEQPGTFALRIMTRPLGGSPWSGRVVSAEPAGPAWSVVIEVSPGAFEDARIMRDNRGLYPLPMLVSPHGESVEIERALVIARAA